MPFMTWNDGFRVGHDEIDRQHREMVDLLNRFFEALKDGGAHETQRQLLERFAAQASEHFATEERELQRVDYHDLFAHRREHEVLRRQVDEFVATFHERKQRCPQAIQLLKKRLVDHFQLADAAYAPYFSKVKS